MKILHRSEHFNFFLNWKTPGFVGESNRQNDEFYKKKVRNCQDKLLFLIMFRMVFAIKRKMTISIDTGEFFA